jgi:drug/metabolite transporter (DMT)-like permease
MGEAIGKFFSRHYVADFFMTIYEFAAIAAAFCWALSGSISRDASQHLGAIGFTRLRLILVFIMLGSWALLSGGFANVKMDMMGIILLSGFIGIFLGDTALFLTMNRLGPRRTSVLFALNAPISAVLSFFILGETLTINEILGILIILCGVILAIIFGKRPSQLHQWEEVKGPLLIGIALGLMAALCQAIGSLLIKPVMTSGADPAAISAIRVGIAALGLSILMQFPNARFKQQNPITLPILAVTAASGFLAMALGVTLLLFALSGGEVGIVSTLSATSPVLLLPLLWFKTREIPAMAAWIGAAMVVIGSALIFNH